MTEKNLKKITLKEIANIADVSVSTVSRVFSGKASISSEVIEKVHEAARYLNNNRYLNDEQSPPFQHIAILVPSSTKIDIQRKQFSWFVLEEIRNYCRKYQRRLDIISYDEKEAFFNVKSNNIDGILLFSLDDEDVIKEISALKIPTVIINGEDPTMTIDSTRPCNRSAGRLAVETLIKKGRRKILHITHLKRKMLQQRYEGFLQAHEKNHLVFMPHQLIEVEAHHSALSQTALFEYIQQYGVDFDAIFASSDALAFGSLRTLKQKNISVPDDVSVIGIDNVLECEFSSPTLTSIHIPKSDLGIKALELLRQRILQPSSPIMRIDLGCTLIERESI